ncbi:MAG: hypothetical protein ACYC96_05345 [Fimbriimonadaceae bacterium]
MASIVTFDAGYDVVSGLHRIVRSGLGRASDAPTALSGRMYA